MSPDFVLAGTGSRSLRVADRATQIAAMDLVTERIAARVVEHDERLVVMSGGAEGFDELLARVAIRQGVRLWLALPNKGYAKHYWGRASLLGRDRTAEFEQILGSAWKVTYVMEQVHGTSALKLDGLHANFWRNQFMADNANDFVVWNPESTGTAHCVTAIKRAGKWRDDMVLAPVAAVRSCAAVHAAGSGAALTG